MNCNCQCNSNNCPQSITYQNSSTCGCQCVNPNFVYNPNTLVCAPPVCQQTCPWNGQQHPDCSCTCAAGFTFNYVTRQCVPVCPETCPWNANQNSDCSCSCQQGLTFNQTSRTCESTSLRQVCPRNVYSCENNQIAYRDCNNNCFCACSAGFAGLRCEIRLEAELCNDCYYDNGHYHAGVKGYCEMYVSCIPHGTNINGTRPQSFTPYIMSCAPGTYYITRPDGWRGCDYLNNGRCTQDKCETLSPNGRYADISTCQSYWQCDSNQRLSTKECCPAGQRFDTISSNCVIDASCPVSCGTKRGPCSNNPDNETVTNNCPYDINPNNENEWFYKTHPDLKLHCQANYVMDLKICQCVKSQDRSGVCDPVVNMNFNSPSMSEEDKVPRIPVTNGQGYAANFRGSDDIILKYFAGSGFYQDFFQINHRIFFSTPVVGSQRVAVATNADCGVRESASILMDGTNFYFRVFPTNAKEAAEIAIPYLGLANQDGWYTVTFTYRKVRSVFEFSGQVGIRRVIYTGPVSLLANIERRNCAFHIGFGFQYASLVAQVDDFQVWTCDPTIIQG